MKFKSVILFLVVGLIFGIGVNKTMAASSAIESLPGGAAIGYFECNAEGLATLVNIQNVDDATAISVHMTLYDKDSTDIVDFPVPLSPRDNVGLFIQRVSDSLIQICSIGPEHWPIFGSANACQTVPLAAIDGRQYGYFTVVINRIDGIANDQNGNGIISMNDQVIGNKDGDPRNDLNFSCLVTGLPSLLPNYLVVRYALVNPNTQSHADTNAIMLQDFLNLCGIREGDPTTVPPTPGTFCDTTGPALALVSYDWDNDGTWNETFGTIDDANGVNIDPYELYITEVADTAVGTAAVVADGGTTIYPALGSANRVYWGRWNVNPGLGLTSYISLVFPASSFTNSGFHQSNRHLDLLVFDDNENPISKSVDFDEVGIRIFGTEIPTPAGAFGGDVRITHARLGNLVGETVNEWAGHVNWYPLVRERINVLVTDFQGTNMLAGRSDVIQLGR